MNIDSVRVRGLFDYFDHDLKFHPDERVMIVIGPNGFGKTTTLRLINTLFNQSMGRLAGLPFRRVEVSFDSDRRLFVEKETRSEQDNGRLPLRLSFQDGSGEVQTFHPRRSRVAQRDDVGIPLAGIEEAIPILERVSLRLWRNRETSDLLDLDDVLTEFSHELPFGRTTSRLPQWLQEVRSAASVRLIDTERLTSIPKLTRRRRSTYHPSRTIHAYSKELAGILNQTNAEYAALSQSLDRTFPTRLVSGDVTSATDMSILVDDLDRIKQKQSRLERVGLLPTDHTSMEIPDLDNVDSSRRDVLAVYAKDTKQKLDVFDDLYPKIEAFMRIANSRLRYKQVSVGVDGLRVVSWTDEYLDLNMLSSGEQHELVILYEMLFRTSNNSLVLIDEPELSLHVAWQEQFVNDLEKMAGISRFRAILATHSPEIIADRWDLTVQLSGPNGA